MSLTQPQLIVFLTLLILSFFCGALFHAGKCDWEQGNKGSAQEILGTVCAMIFVIPVVLDFVLIVNYIITNL